jgi:SHS family sialic acid transporter-like MFS transporter
VGSNRRNLALVAALLGWMFDGFEMGLFPLVARPALRDLLGAGVAEDVVGKWYGVITAGFLVGAAAGGVLFGRLGDRVGRVRAMTLSILVYAGCSGLCGFAAAPWQLAGLRFVSALGMGGEWALGVALVMELFADTSRGRLAGLIGAAGNLGYGIVAVLALTLNELPAVAWAGPSNWRLLLLAGVLPALLTLFVRFFVPESSRWEQVRDRGQTRDWAANDYLFIGVGTLCGVAMVGLWAIDLPLALRAAGTLVLVVAAAACFVAPVVAFLARGHVPHFLIRHDVKHLLLGAGLSGVPLLATWAGVMWQYNFVHALTHGLVPSAAPVLMLVSSVGAAIGCVGVALLGDRVGRRPVYATLCVLSCVTLLSFYTLHDSYTPWLVLHSGLVGVITAGFYGWLPLYLPELFPTAIRAAGQGFSFNFGRMIAAVGALQMTALLSAFDNDYARACSVTAAVYVVGLLLIWRAPETRGKPLPA